jgi:hypothetical protein
MRTLYRRGNRPRRRAVGETRQGQRVQGRTRWIAIGLVLAIATPACTTAREAIRQERHEIRQQLRSERAGRAAPPDGSAGGAIVVSTGAGNPYDGLGTWIDIYDDEAWADPWATVAAMRAVGVRTIYLQTSNFNRGRPFVHAEGVERFLDAAAANDLEVVAWYLPGFRDVRTDLKRALAAIRLTTPSGNRFASFALDIESPEVNDPAARTRRLLGLSNHLRREVGPEFRLGAIVPSPRRVRTDPSYWSAFPYREIAEVYDVFLPMTYFTYRVAGRDGAAWYTAKNILILRQETAGLRVPIHVIGGIASDATAQETRGFVDTIRTRDVIGASYYTFPMIRDDQWRSLRTIG